MKKKKNPRKKGKIQITMNRKFSEFKKEDKKNFEEDLSEVAEIDEEDIKEKKYRRQCVFFEGEMDQTIIDNLIHQYEKRKDACKTKDSVKMNTFVKKHSIKQLFQIEKAKLDVITSKKTNTARDLIRSDRVLYSKHILDIVKALGYNSTCFYTDNNIFFGFILDPLVLLAVRCYRVVNGIAVQEPLHFFMNSLIKRRRAENPLLRRSE